MRFKLFPLLQTCSTNRFLSILSNFQIPWYFRVWRYLTFSGCCYVLLAISVFTLPLLNSRTSAQTIASHGEVDEAVSKAKRDGVSTATIPMGMPYPAKISSLEQARETLCFFRAKLTASAVMMASNHEDILTWYKFTVKDDLSLTRRVPGPVTQPSPTQIPAALLPVLDDEILVLTVGGEVKVDGITVKHGDTRPLFLKGQLYLLMLLGGDSANPAHTYVLPLDKSTAFAIGQDGDTLTPVHAQANSAIQDDVAQRFHHSLSMLSTGNGVKE